MSDIVRLNRRSVDVTVGLVAGLSEADLDRPTPCAGWTVRDLVEHQIVQNHGFAFAASGQPSELAFWQPKPMTSLGDYPASARAVVAAFAELGVLERAFWLPEVRTSAPIPARLAIGFHFIDCVVHGWDLAKAVGVPPRFDEDLLAACLPLTLAVPDTAEARPPGKAFVRGVPVAEDAPVLDRIVAHLGRRPDWSPERAG
ncbi:TIGR03086 family metal-binding protein [Nonomuraea sp. NPDC050328]|uniref:TIGR03086 family metal-binding protein n=1 Tax=Nonomuraea sp. NPDC050328 TaxID=3364361 RepID=UPI0037A88403